MASATHARPRRGAHVGPIVAGAFLAIVAAFVASAAFTLHQVVDAERVFPSVVQRDVTAIAHATVLRAELEDAEEMLTESTEGHPWEPGAMRRAIAAIDRETALARVAYADDVDVRLRGAAFEAIGQARGGIDGLRVSLEEGDVAASRRAMHESLRPRLQRADAALTMLLQASIDELTQASADQARARDHAARAALALDAMCVMVAFAAGALAVLTVWREHARLRAQVTELQILAEHRAEAARAE